MVVSRKQYAILYSLYKNYIDCGTIKTYVTCKGISTSTMKSLLKTGLIETDRAIRGIPTNMRLTQKGIDTMAIKTSIEKNTISALISNNKMKIDHAKMVNEKTTALFIELKDKNITITDKGYGIFSVTKPKEVEVFYEVYTKQEAELILGQNYKKDKLQFIIRKVKFNEENIT